MTAFVARNQDGTFAKQRFVSWDGSDWDDGWINDRGYFVVYLPEHPNATNSGWVRRFHAVWWLRTGQSVNLPHCLHHKNENKLDDRFENLEFMLHGEHSRMHHRKEPVAIICLKCGKEFYKPKWKSYQKFCSQVCQKSYPVSEETKRKHSESLKLAYSEGRRIGNEGNK